MVSTSPPQPPLVCATGMTIRQVGHPTAAKALAHGFRVEVLGVRATVRPRARVSESVAQRVGLTRRVVARGPATPSSKPCGYSMVRLHFRPRAQRKLRDESPLIAIANVGSMWQKMRFR